MILRARVVLPVSGPPIENGAIEIIGDRVAKVGVWADFAQAPSKSVVDLGDSLVLPGLVNAHCHLDYTDMAGLFSPTNFPDWVKGLVAHKASWSYADYAQSWIRGAHMLARSGTTTVADVEAVPELLPEVWSATELRVVSFLELTCVKSQRESDSILSEASERVHLLKPKRGFVGLAPHALYSTSTRLLEAIAEECRKEQWRTTVHVAESPEEFEMYTAAGGPLYDWLKKQRDMSDCGKGTPVRQLHRCGLLGENLLAVHVNYLQAADMELLAQAQASVAHCPRSHAYFSYDPFPVEALMAKGVNICLGTDSLASIRRVRGKKPELNLFAEMEEFILKNPSFPPAAVLQMATLNGARALGMQGRVGELSKGSFADLITVPFTGQKKDAAAAVVECRGAAATMIHGSWVIAPKGWII